MQQRRAWRAVWSHYSTKFKKSLFLFLFSSAPDTSGHRADRLDMGLVENMGIDPARHHHVLVPQRTADIRQRDVGAVGHTGKGVAQAVESNGGSPLTSTNASMARVT